MKLNSRNNLLSRNQTNKSNQRVSYINFLEESLKSLFDKMLININGDFVSFFFDHL